jgi:hypothetical protein
MAHIIAEKIKPTIENSKTVELLKDIIVKIDNDPTVVELMMNLLIDHFKVEQKDGIVSFESFKVFNLVTKLNEIRIRLIISNDTDMYIWVEDDKIHFSMPL